MGHEDYVELWISTTVLCMTTVLFIAMMIYRSRTGTIHGAHKDHLTIAPYVYTRHDREHEYHHPKQQFIAHHPYRYHYPYPQHKRRAIPHERQ